MKEICEFLKKCGTYYLATVEDGAPRVRPFGTAHVIDGKLCIQTGKIKPVYRQIAAEPRVEISAFDGGTWIRVSGELYEDDRRESRREMLDAYPELRRMYNEDDGNTAVLAFKSGKATFYSFTAPPRTVEF